MKTITIMPDDGIGDYAWEKDASDDTTWVGLDIAGIGSGFVSAKYKVTPALEAAFAAWVVRLGNGTRTPHFDWNSFHVAGIDLSRRIKAELGDSVRVVYSKPAEDPGRVWTERTEILVDGSLKPILVRKVARSE